MSAPRKIWIRITDGSLMPERPSDADEHDNLYYHDDVVRELVEALERIRDGRGICSTCGTWAVGEGSGYTACDCSYPNWDLPDPSAVADAALAKIAQEDQR